eukprot:Ihof_evm4s154 gene=Ihof_evmTU4s154
MQEALSSCIAAPKKFTNSVRGSSNPLLTPAKRNGTSTNTMPAEPPGQTALLTREQMSFQREFLMCNSLGKPIHTSMKSKITSGPSIEKVDSKRKNTDDFPQTPSLEEDDETCNFISSASAEIMLPTTLNVEAPGPFSPLAEETDLVDQFDTEPKASFKEAKKDYKNKIKELSRELLTDKADEIVIANVVRRGNLKMRDAFKSWHERYFVLVPGMLHYYRNKESGSHDYMGTINLETCQIIERPSKKDGFCFKIFQPQGRTIYATKTLVESLPINADVVILRTIDIELGRQWFGDIVKMVYRSPMDVAASSRPSVEQDNMECTTQDDSSSDGATSEEEAENEPDDEPIEATNYVPVNESFSLETGSKTGEMGEENKSIIWSLLKQVKPGMDLSKITLPTFILEPRSFLQLISDYYYHCDILSVAAKTQDPLQRMVEVVRWYVSGFYKKPKGVKKPYNPLLGEMYRCQWSHSDGARTCFVAEQVSHHPPISSWYASNRQHGWCTSGTFFPKSHFNGNSASASLEGHVELHFHEHNEDYILTYPSAVVKGLFFGTMLLELSGEVTITCLKTGLTADIEFRQKDTSPLWVANAEAINRRLHHFDVSPEEQTEKDSQKLWTHVTAAILNGDQVQATEEKNKLEEAQRTELRKREDNHEVYRQKVFRRGPRNFYYYSKMNLNAWNSANDMYEYERDGVIRTKCRYKKNGDYDDNDQGPTNLSQVSSSDSYYGGPSIESNRVKNYLPKDYVVKKTHKKGSEGNTEKGLINDIEGMHSKWSSEGSSSNLEMQLYELESKVQQILARPKGITIQTLVILLGMQLVLQ